jgi:dUTP pyrophosphatase
MSDLLRVQRLHPDAVVPKRATSGSAGYDLYAPKDVFLKAKARETIFIGIRLWLPEGTYGRIAPRSGLAIRYGISSMGGVVDIDFRQEIAVILINHGDENHYINKGDRIAQLILEKIKTPAVLEVSASEMAMAAIEEEEHKGFGSSGR